MGCWPVPAARRNRHHWPPNPEKWVAAPVLIQNNNLIRYPHSSCYDPYLFPAYGLFALLSAGTIIVHLARADTQNASIVAATLAGEAIPTTVLLGLFPGVIGNVDFTLYTGNCDESHGVIPYLVAQLSLSKISRWFTWGSIHKLKADRVSAGMRTSAFSGSNALPNSAFKAAFNCSHSTE